MGSKVSHGPQRTQENLIEEKLQMNPIEIWKNSQHQKDDMLQLIEGLQKMQEWGPLTNAFFRTIRSKQKYQSYLHIIIKYLQSEQARRRESQDQLKELFTNYKKKLKNSYFVDGEFHEDLLESIKSPAEKMFYLYRWTTLQHAVFEQAISQNYPEIFSQCARFGELLMEQEVFVADPTQLVKFILSRNNLDVIRQQSKIEAALLTRADLETFIEASKKCEDLCQTYLQIAEVFLSFDNADTAAAIMIALLDRGYQLTNAQTHLLLKIKIYSCLLYDFGQITLKFSSIRHMQIPQLLHYFYSNQIIEESKALSDCFKIFQDNGAYFQECLKAYIFSDECHFSIMLGIIKQGVFIMEDTPECYALFERKVFLSRTEIARNMVILESLIKFFSHNRQKLEQLQTILAVAEVLNFFDINITLQQIHQIRQFHQGDRVNQANLHQLQDKCLGLLDELLMKFLQKNKESKRLKIGTQVMDLNEPESIFKIVQFLQGTIFGNIISSQQTHQRIFKYLLEGGRFNQVRQMLSPSQLSRHNIIKDMIQQIIVQNIQCSLQRQRLQRINNDLLSQLRILNLFPFRNDEEHHIVYFYYYFKHLEDRGIFLSRQMKENVSIEHLYYIVKAFPEKIEAVDFDELYRFQCAFGKKQQKGVFIVTEELLKFKVYLCNQAFLHKKAGLANELLQEIINYEPPWLSTQLAKICKANRRFDQQFLLVAFKFCSRGNDLQIIMELINQKKKETGLVSSVKLLQENQLISMLASTKKFIVENDQIIRDEKEYRNLVAEMSFNDQSLKECSFGRFFVLLGTEPVRAFHLAILAKLQLNSVFTFISEGMKREIFKPIETTLAFHKYVYYCFRCKFQQEWPNSKQFRHLRNQDIPKLEQLIKNIAVEQKASYISRIFQKTEKAYQCLEHMSRDFMTNFIPRKQSYAFLYDESYRNNIVTTLLRKPMSKTEFLMLVELCKPCKIDIIDLAIFTLASSIDSEKQPDSNIDNVTDKIAQWASNQTLAGEVLGKACLKAKNIENLMRIIVNLKESPNHIFRAFITADHLLILGSLASIEVVNQFQRIIPANFLTGLVGRDATRKFSEKERSNIAKISTKFNIFILSKAAYFIYGMNSEVQRQILCDFLNKCDPSQFQQLRQRVAI